MDCAARQISHVKPFGNITEKLGSSIKRSMTAARAIWKAVKSASEISNEMKSVSKMFLYHLIVGSIVYIKSLYTTLKGIYDTRRLM